MSGANFCHISTFYNSRNNKMIWDDETSRKDFFDNDYFNKRFKKEFESFTEGDITFPPTFRYNEKGVLTFKKGGLTTNYFVPGYADRILYSSNSDKFETTDDYGALAYAGSSHLPVRTYFKYDNDVRLVVYTYNLGNRFTINPKFIKHVKDVSEKKSNFVVVLFQGLNVNINVHELSEQMGGLKVFTGCHSPRHGHLAIFTNVGSKNSRHKFGVTIDKCMGSKILKGWATAAAEATQKGVAANYQGFIRMSIYSKTTVVATIYNIHAPAYDSAAQDDFFTRLQFDMVGIKNFIILAGDFNSRSLVNNIKNLEGTKNSKTAYETCSLKTFKQKRINPALLDSSKPPEDDESQNDDFKAQLNSVFNQREREVTIRDHLIREILNFYQKKGHPNIFGKDGFLADEKAVKTHCAKLDEQRKNPELIESCELTINSIRERGLPII